MTSNETENLGGFHAKVLQNFTTSVTYSPQHKVTKDYKKEDIVLCESWKPEGMTVDGVFVWNKDFDKLEIIKK